MVKSCGWPHQKMSIYLVITRILIELKTSDNMKIKALEPNPTKFCIHNLWATRRLKMQKLTAKMGGGGNKNLGPYTKLIQKSMENSSGWLHQNVSIYY